MGERRWLQQEQLFPALEDHPAAPQIKRRVALQPRKIFATLLASFPFLLLIQGQERDNGLVSLASLAQEAGYGFVFLSLEDETGISNVIVNPDLYEKFRKVINGEKFRRVDGVLQNQDHTISIKAARVLPLSITGAETESHDFH